MSTLESADDAVYIGAGWLLYASRGMQFSHSEFVAPGVVLTESSNNLRLDIPGVTLSPASAYRHAGGCWSSLAEPVDAAVLYLDPLLPAGAALQRMCEGSVAVEPLHGALADLAEQLGLACEGRLEAPLLTGLVERWCEEVLKRSPVTVGVDVRLQHLRDWLTEHREGRVDLPALAEKVGLSGDHLRQQFRRQVGMTLSSYQAWLRLYGMGVLACEAAARALREETVALMQAAGFYDASHASRTIRRYLDLKPSEMLSPGCFVDCRPSA